MPWVLWVGIIVGVFNTFLPICAAEDQRSMAERTRDMDAALEAVGVRENISFVYYVEFLAFHHRHFSKPGTNGHQHDVEWISYRLPSEMIKAFRETTFAVSSVEVLNTLSSPMMISSRTSLILVDSAYAVYLVNMRGVVREEALKMALNSARAFKDLFAAFRREEYLSSLANREEVLASMGETAQEFISTRIPTLPSQDLEAWGQALEQLWQNFKRWKAEQLKQFDMVKHVNPTGPCRLHLKKTPPSSGFSGRPPAAS